MATNRYSYLLAAARSLAEGGARLLVLTNRTDSALAALGPAIDIRAGPERAVAATKSFAGTVTALLAVPILIQVLFNASLAYGLNRWAGERHDVACPSALIGASNFFELAVAAAISLFGFKSGAALATVVGVLIEVPVMLLVVRVVNRSKGWYEAGRA